MTKMQSILCGKRVNYANGYDQSGALFIIETSAITSAQLKSINKSCLLLCDDSDHVVTGCSQSLPMYD